MPSVLEIVAVGCLVTFSALFSGLTLGLLSLDGTNLEVLQEAGDEKQRLYAKAIRPLREHGNLLLCTLLLGNTLVNTLLSIMLARILDSVQGFMISTALILIFGEIIPQAICSRYGLVIGAHTVYLTKFFMGILLPVTLPISWVLNKVLGSEIGLMYNRQELRRLISLHVEKHAAESDMTVLDAEDHDLLTGVLDYKQKCVGDVMTTLGKVFMIEYSTRLSFDAILDIYKSGYTRIPVYDKTRDNVVGILYAKDLILVDPNDEVEVKTILAFHEKKVIKVLDTTPLNIVFRMFKTSFCHLLVAVNLEEKSDMWMQNIDKMNHTLQCPQKVVGIITLEDVLEELIKTEIVDESDKYVDNVHDKLTTSTRRKEMQRYLDLFSYRTNQGSNLTSNEVEAVAIFLTQCCKDFKRFDKSSSSFVDFIKESEVLEFGYEFMSKNKDGYSLYTRGAPSDEVIIVLAGSVQVASGKERFITTLGPWSILGANMLSAPRSKTYIVDFSAYAKGEYCRFLKMSRQKFFIHDDLRNDEQREARTAQNEREQPSSS